jgi:hypothetical protein
MTETEMISKGYKRLLSAVLVLVSRALSVLPGLSAITLITEIIAGGIGVVGVGHATQAGTLKGKKLISLAALCAALLAAAPFIPALAPYVPLIQNIAAILAALGVGNEAVKKIRG